MPPASACIPIDDDRASRCDEFVNPGYASLEGCTDSDRTVNAVDEWGSDFSGATGILLGADYRVSESLMVGLRGRWAEFDTLQGGGGYESLRNHASNLRLDGSEPVIYRTRNPDNGFFGLSLSVTYRL